MSHLSTTLDLNDPGRFYEIRRILIKKKALRAFYLEVYQKYRDCIHRSPQNGLVVEIGSGAGFAKEVIPQLISSDIVAYPNIDRVMDASQLKFDDASLSCICLFNVLHHIPNIPVFFNEAIRCLMPGGRIIMIEPYAGWLSSWIFKYFHHEGFDPHVKQWEFISHGPVSDANNALPSVIFERDIERFRREFSALSIARFSQHSPLRYWLTGGLQNWSLLPMTGYKLASFIDRGLIRLSPRFGSFVDIELVRV